jgi:hypothetical protein
MARLPRRGLNPTAAPTAPAIADDSRAEVPSLLASRPRVSSGRGGFVRGLRASAGQCSCRRASGIGHSSSLDFGRPYAAAFSPRSAAPGEWRPWSSSAPFPPRPPANASPDLSGHESLPALVDVHLLVLHHDALRPAHLEFLKERCSSGPTLRMPLSHVRNTSRPER